MKKYRLIKEYPGSSSLGTIFHIGGFAGDVSKYPEFFEEVVEKDYEILSYFKKDRPACVTTKKRGGERHEEFWNIHSVKRLSDGEVFTVGDIVEVREQGSKKVIEKFEIVNDKSSIRNGVWIEYPCGGSHLRNATKVKHQIFLTHDGKDIFEGDTVWYVNKKTFAYHYVTAYPDGGFHSSINAYFLTKSAAENYLIQKSHSLSIEDFWEFICWGGSTIAKSKRLKRLVKERLNLK